MNPSTTQPPTLYLASGSPRRREILENLGFHIIRITAEIDETPHINEAPAAYVARMAAEKNCAAVAAWQAGQTHMPAHPILTADTTVALDNHILGKPESAEHAHTILSLLSGRTHQVLTADCGCLMNINGSLEKQKQALRGQHLASFLWQRTGGGQ